MTELAAANGSERTQALLKLTQRLTALIQEETRLFKARRPHEAIELQTSFARSQFDAFGAQAKDMQELSTKLAGEMNETFKGAVEKASKDFKAA